MHFDPSKPLPAAPQEPIDETGAPRIGAYAGSMDRVVLDALIGDGLRGHWRRKTQLKRWQYVMLTSREVVLAFAMVDLSYASNAFCFAVDRGQRRLVFDRSFLDPLGRAARVGERPGVGASSDFSAGPARFHFERVGGKYLGTARIDPSFSLDFTLDTQAAAPPVSLVVPVQGGILNCTQKWSGLPVQGSLVIGDRRYDLDGGYGGLDFTTGLLARETVWRWAFGAGVTTDGQPVGFNLGEGVNSAIPGENAIWLGQTPAYLPDVVFTFDRGQPLAPWRIKSDDGSVDLTFTGHGMHREARNLIVAKSRFAQVAGEFSGRLRAADGRSVAVVGLPGVVEDQFVRW